MLVIICPHCGPRNSDEFTYQGEVKPRPDVTATEPGEWRRYLYMKSNERGWVNERWFHGSGCRRFLMVERHTASNEIRKVEVVA
ncbi:MAG: sarcosine oxidase subunit delta [Acidimicrobiia bacterium]|jgi:heterotetrameric sarcosine oxidase delta subunit